ncbi:hypothetical protein NDU88_005478 [Pleurodeles waltl]|uniref:Uncharacterized protein n=1 Tax=Pleurodeles waltl TaxID=8319 RepID=A0AAV7WYS6_PLEWA|nr:hypothetical protein NDU88_005478 [Pleurodeles waltl]
MEAEIPELVPEELQFLVSVRHGIESTLVIYEAVIKLCHWVLETGYVCLDLFGFHDQVHDLGVHDFQAMSPCSMASMAMSERVLAEALLEPEPIGAWEEAMVRGCEIASEKSS